MVTAVDVRGLADPLGRPIRPLDSRAPDCLAKSYTDVAFSTLLDVAMNGSSDTARIAAAAGNAAARVVLMSGSLERGDGQPIAFLPYKEVCDE